MSAYTEGYPPDGSSLGQTKAVIRGNLDSTFNTLAVDHVNNNGTNAGYHTIIHEVPQATAMTTAGFNQVFCGVPGTLIVDGVTTSAIPGGGTPQLYSLNAGGILSQLTGKVPGGTLIPPAVTSGYAWMGGILMQWGFSLISGGTGTVTFPKEFPIAILNLQLNLVVSSSITANSIYPIEGTIEDTGFGWRFLGTVGYSGFTWFAIGN